VQQAYDIFKTIIRFYGINNLIDYVEELGKPSVKEFVGSLPKSKLERGHWLNVGGQLLSEKTIATFRDRVHKSIINSWDDVHDFSRAEGEKYASQKKLHAITSLLE